MNTLFPFIMSLVMFILCWLSLMNLPYLESISSNKVIVYASFSLFISMIVFVMLGMIYRLENLHVNPENLRSNFEIPGLSFFQVP